MDLRVVLSPELGVLQEGEESADSWRLAGLFLVLFQLKSMKTKRFLLHRLVLKSGFYLFFDWWRMTSSTRIPLKFLKSLVFIFRYSPFFIQFVLAGPSSSRDDSTFQGRTIVLVV